MGKRELLILVAFGVAGMIAFQVTAPPPREGGSRFTLARLLESWRRNGRGNSASASTTREGTLAVARTLRELRLSSGATVVILGEERADIAYSMTVQAMGPDQATAQRTAMATALKQDDLGDALALVVMAPSDPKPATRLTLRVPARLGVRIDGARHAEVSGVSALFLDNLIGDTTIAQVSGRVSGTHRNGTLTVRDAGELALTLVSSKASLSHVRGALTVNGRNGDVHVEDAAGPIVLDTTGQAVTIANSTGAINVTGTGGEVTIDRPHGDVHVDVRHANVTLLLAQPVSATLLTADARLRVQLPADALAIAIDAVADGGKIDAQAIDATVTTSGSERRLVQHLGNAPRITLRATHGDIEITRRK
jgi:hypothetical protein